MTDDVEKLIAKLKPAMAFTLGAMIRKTNFIMMRTVEQATRMTQKQYKAFGLVESGISPFKEFQMKWS